MRWIALLVALALGGCGAVRRWAMGSPKFGGSIDMAARAGTQPELAEGEERVHQVAGRVDLRGVVGADAALAMGFDVELGGERPAGLVYGTHLQPLGAALRFGRRGWLGVMAGAGLGGVVGRVPFAWELPVTSFLELDGGRWARAYLAGRAIWIAGSDARQDGATLVDWTDELELGAGVAIGKRHLEHGGVWSDGTYVGVLLREQGGERMVGLVLAIGMNGAMR